MATKKKAEKKPAKKKAAPKKGTKKPKPTTRDIRPPDPRLP